MKNSVPFHLSVSLVTILVPIFGIKEQDSIEKCSLPGLFNSCVTLAKFL